MEMPEIEHSGKTYTYETLERLKQENQDTEYYFILFFQHRPPYE